MTGITLWVEKYRPKDLDGYVFKNSDMENQIKSWLARKDGNGIPFPNLLLSGNPGSGKTTLSSIICNIFNIEQSDILTINASRENNVETVREKIVGFCETYAVGDYKVVRLEECLAEDEEIVTPRGPVRIGSLEHDKVYEVFSFNMETRKIEPDHATVISDREAEVYKVTLEDDREIQTTLNHPFLVEEDGKIVERELKDLVAGDEIVAEPFDTATIRSIEQVGRKRVVNLNVKKNHTFITANGIITHNCDHLSVNAQAILRTEIERFHESVRFILTCNYPNKIIPALHSRLQSYHFDKVDEEGFLLKLVEILEAEGVKYDPDNVGLVFNKAYPDLRKAINLLEQHTRDGELHPIVEASSSADYMLDIVGLFAEKKYTEARKLICSQIQNEEYETVYRYFYDNLEIFGDSDDKQTRAIMAIAQGLRDHAVVADPEINLSATICRLIEIMKE